MPPSQVDVIKEAIYKTHKDKKYYVENNTLKIYAGESITNDVTFEYTVDFYIVDQNNSYSKMSNYETGCQNCASFITNACKNLVSCSSPLVDIPVQCSTVLNGEDYKVTDYYNIGNTPYGSIIIGQYMWDTVAERKGHGGGGMVGGARCDEIVKIIEKVAKYLDVLYTVILVYDGESPVDPPRCDLMDEHVEQGIDYIENSAVSTKGVYDYLKYFNKNDNQQCKRHIDELKKLIGSTTVRKTDLELMGDVEGVASKSTAVRVTEKDEAAARPYEMMKDTILAYFGRGDATKLQGNYISAANECYKARYETSEDINALFSDDILLLLEDDFFIRFGDNNKRKKETIEDRHRLGRHGGGKKITHRKHRRKQKHTRRSKPNKKKRTKKHRKKRKYTKYRR